MEGLFTAENIQPTGIVGGLNAILSFIIASKLYLSYTKRSSTPQKYFLWFYINLGLFFSIISLTQYILKGQGSAYWIAFFNIIAFFFLNLGIGFLLAFSLIMTGREKQSSSILAWIISYAIVYSFFRIVYFEPSELQVFEYYAFWKPVFPIWLRIITGLFAVMAGLSLSYLFFKNGFQNKHDRYIYRRSMIMGSGVSIVMFASIIAFIASPIGNFSMLITASTTTFVGLLVMMKGAYYKKKIQI